MRASRLVYVTSSEAPGRAISVRAASAAELDAVRAIDALAFESGEATEFAAEGEFEQGVREQGLLVAIRDDDIVGFVQFGPTAGTEWFLHGVAVHPGHAGNGIAKQMVGSALEQIRERTYSEPRVAATTSPTNTAMIRVLTEAGFVGTAWIDGYFGPGKDRVYFETNGSSSDYTERILVPANSTSSVKDLLHGKRHLLATTRLPHGWVLEVATPLDSEPASVQTNEGSVSSAFAGTLMAAFTFLFGFALTTTEIGTDLLGASGVGVLVSLLALIAYTNASGDLARLKPRAWDRLIRVGNAWSEFGSVYVLFALTPTLVLSATGASVGSVVVAAVSSLLLFAYHFSRMDISHRYARWPGFWTAVRWAYTVLPVAALGVYAATGATWPWTLGLASLSLASLIVSLRLGAEDP